MGTLALKLLNWIETLRFFLSMWWTVPTKPFQDPVSTVTLDPTSSPEDLVTAARFLSVLDSGAVFVKL